MAFWQRIKSYFNSLATKSDPQQTRYIIVPSRHAGVTVDHDTALKFSAFYCGVSYIAQTIACLPWMVIRERSESKTRLFSHPIAKLLHQRPNPEMNAISFRETMVAHALTWGNGYAEIETDSGGRPVYLWPITPDRVEVKRSRDTGEVEYQISNYFGETTVLPPGKMFHLHGLGFDGLVGYSLVSLAARAIGLSIAAESCGEDFYANGLVSTGYLKMAGRLSPERADALGKELREKFAGQGKRWIPPVFQDGMEWGQMSMKPEDAQMLASREFQVSDMARWFHLPPHKLAQLMKTSYSSIEAQSIEVVNDALLPWVIRLEQEANYKLFKGTEQGIYTKLNLTSLLRGDTKSRGEFYKLMTQIGAFCINDVLRLEDMDPIGPEGDERIIQVNMTTLKRIIEGEPVQPEPAPAPDNEPDQAVQQAKVSYLMLFEDAERRILGREIGQFNQVLHKFLDKSENFTEWADKFFARHREYMEQTLSPLVQSLAMLMAPVARINGNLSPILDAYIENHVETSIRVFSELRNFTEIETKDRTKQAAQSLIEQVLTCVALTEAPDETMVQH